MVKNLGAVTHSRAPGPTDLCCFARGTSLSPFPRPPSPTRLATESSGRSRSCRELRPGPASPDSQVLSHTVLADSRACLAAGHVGGWKHFGLRNTATRFPVPTTTQKCIGRSMAGQIPNGACEFPSEPGPAGSVASLPQRSGASCGQLPCWSIRGRDLRHRGCRALPAACCNRCKTRALRGPPDCTRNRRLWVPVVSISIRR